MNELEAPEEKKPRHWIPVLPQPRPDTLQRAKEATRRSTRRKVVERKLDAVLGPIDEDL